MFAFLGLIASAFSGLVAASAENPYHLQEGDIVFSSSPAGQGQAIIDATKSPYTHCGIVFQQGGKLMVLEAVEPVGITTLEKFVSRSSPEAFTARRLKTPLAPDAYQKAREWGKAQIGHHYDQQFRWDDQKMYCSELVWKIYEHAGVRLCEPSHFRDYHLDQPSVKKVIEERYGSIDKLPLDECVVAPGELATSNLLMPIPPSGDDRKVR
ncbi:MAG: YiiX/YebB-like N1pC/P60 family cysteine hydrolase [Luteolibacter sp.]